MYIMNVLVHNRVLVKTPLTNYKKSREILEKHAACEYHVRAVDRAYFLKRRFVNPQQKIDTRLTDVNDTNYRYNSDILPAIFGAVIVCARQRIALQGHQQDKIVLETLPDTVKAILLHF